MPYEVANDKATMGSAVCGKENTVGSITGGSVHMKNHAKELESVRTLARAMADTGMREHGRTVPNDVTHEQSKAYMELRTAIGEMKRARWKYTIATHINVYEVCLCYGGHQEGGWYFDAGNPIASIPIAGMSRAEIDTLEKSIYRQYQLEPGGRYALRNDPDHEDFDRERARGRTSCAGGYDIEVYFEDHFAVAFPDSRPRYE